MAATSLLDPSLGASLQGLLSQFGPTQADIDAANQARMQDISAGLLGARRGFLFPALAQGLEKGQADYANMLKTLPAIRAANLQAAMPMLSLNMRMQALDNFNKALSAAQAPTTVAGPAAPFQAGPRTAADAFSGNAPPPAMLPTQQQVPATQADPSLRQRLANANLGLSMFGVNATPALQFMFPQPTRVNQGGGVYDQRTGKFNVIPQTKPGYQPEQQPDGSWRIVPVAGGPQANTGYAAGTSTGTEAGRFPGRVVDVEGPGNAKITGFGSDVFGTPPPYAAALNAAGLAPPQGRPAPAGSAPPQNITATSPMNANQAAFAASRSGQPFAVTLPKDAQGAVPPDWDIVGAAPGGPSPAAPTGGSVTTNPNTGTRTYTSLTDQQETEQKTGGEKLGAYEQTVHEAAAAASSQNAQLGEMAKLASRFTPSATLPERSSIANLVQDVPLVGRPIANSLVGNSATALPAIQGFTKLAVNMVAAQAKVFGSREAVQIVDMVKSALPNVGMVPGAPQIILGFMSGMNKYALDTEQAMSQWKQQHAGSIAGFQEYWHAVAPATKYVPPLSALAQIQAGERPTMPDVSNPLGNAAPGAAAQGWSAVRIK